MLRFSIGKCARLRPLGCSAGKSETTPECLQIIPILIYIRVSC